jgi:ribonuclease HII
MLSFYYGEPDEEWDTQIGVDEVGRGCLAGPVVSAAVVWDVPWLMENAEKYKTELSTIKDSKKLSEKKRKEMSEFIKMHAKAYGISFIDPEVIDKINILNATYKAMHSAIDKAIDCLSSSPNQNSSIDRIIVDGSSFKTYIRPIYNENDDHDEYDRLFVIPHVCVINGDNKYLSIASASILAKVSRDEYMVDLCEKSAHYQEHYDWVQNKGYGTKKHLDGIHQHGLTEHHRKTFGVCKTKN